MPKITCTYGTPCHISFSESTHLLCLDFNILSYKALTPTGWSHFLFPKNIFIQDKLFLNFETINSIAHHLSHFVENGYVKDCELYDFFNNTISLQNSSSASQAKIWFGLDPKIKPFQFQNNQMSEFIFPYHDHVISDRLHLNQSQAKKLINILIQESTKILNSKLPQPQGTHATIKI